MRKFSGLLSAALVFGLCLSAAHAADDPQALNAKGTAKYQAGDHKGGIALVEKAVSLAESTSGDDSEAADQLKFNLALMRATDGNIKAAAPLFDSVTAHYAKRYGDKSIRLADAYFKIGTLLVTLDPRAASKNLGKAIDIYETMTKASPPKTSENYIKALTQSGVALARQGKRKDARHAFKAAIDQSEHLFGKKAQITGEAHFSFGSFLQAIYPYREAIKEFRKALDVFELGLPDTLSLYKETSLNLIGLEAPKQAIARAKTLSKLIPDELIPPVMIRITPAPYPRSAAVQGIEGCVKLAFTVAADGTVKDVRVTGGQHADVFGQAAIETIRKFQYAPALLNSHPVEHKEEFSESFALGNPPKYKRCE